MPASTRTLVAIGAGAAVLSAAGVAAAKRGLFDVIPAGDPPLNARRRFVLDVLQEIVPSQYPDDKFRALAGDDYDPNDPKLPPGFTTCGFLPFRVGRRLNVVKPWGITAGGLESMRINGRALNAWIEPNGKNRPKPGDLYGIGGQDIIVHVGVYKRRVDIERELREKRANAEPLKGWARKVADQEIAKLEKWKAAGIRELWETADSGQEMKGQPGKSAFVMRPYDPTTNTLISPIDGKARPLAGWFDIDKAPGAKP